MRFSFRRATASSPVVVVLSTAAVALVSAALSRAEATRPAAAERPANVLLITVDTLRADRLSGYGYPRPTSPHIDRLLATSARFTEARTVEPLTTPALASMLTALHPHEHGATRNGLTVRPRLPSLPKLLARRGYATAAFVANWTLRDQLSGLAEHFADYHEIFTRKRWLGLFRAEATAADVNEAALDWLAEHSPGRRPFFLWVHYVEPHAPYLFHEKEGGRLGLDRNAGRSDRYDTEVAFVDEAVGELLAWLAARPAVAACTLVVFTADHGESLGEHGVWGHGRNLYDEALRIPLAFAWSGRLPPRTVDAPASIIDLPATILGLLGRSVPVEFHGFDWSGALTAGEPPAADRATYHQAHKGAVLASRNARQGRENGLLEVAVLRHGQKEALRPDGGRHLLFDLRADPAERVNLNGDGSRPSAELAAWLAQVEEGLAAHPADPSPLDDESAARLRSLGYLE